MPIGITEDHVALHEAVRGWLERHCPPAVPRALLDAEREERPELWADLAAQGWLGLHVDEAFGGSGYGTAELCVVLEELGHSLAPGPILPTALAASVVAQSTNEAAHKVLLPALASGELVAAVGGGPGCGLEADAGEDGLVVRGTIRPVLGGALADVLVAPARTGATTTWLAIDLTGAGVTRTELPSVDPTRRVAEIVCDGAVVGADRQLDGIEADDRARARPRRSRPPSSSASRSGASRRPPSTPSDRVQFGRPIGQFQGVKHRCADMLCRVELARAAAWDAARAVDDGVATMLAASSAIALALDAAFENGKDCIQVLGGIGFTWEHEAHMYLQRAMSLGSILGPSSRWRTTRVRARARRRASRPVGRPRPRGRRAAHRAARVPRRGRRAPRRRAAHAGGRRRLPHADVAAAVGSRREGRRAGRDRRGVPRRQGRAAGDHDRRRWALPPRDHVRHPGAAGALDPADAARRDHVVPAVQRARRGIRPREPRRRAPSASRAGGSSTARRCGRRWPQHRRLGHPPGAHRPREAEARRHLVLHGRHAAHRRHRHPAAARAHRRRDVQRGVLRRRLRARRLPRRAGQRRLAQRAHDARQRAGVHGRWHEPRPRSRERAEDGGRARPRRRPVHRRRGRRARGHRARAGGASGSG